ncbi:MAG: D-alanyl-D-alaninecarboxypeptidase/D-alanyl-D-alanine-endopeptidase [Thermoleophilia bacterium]|nr:D-alanyl-D-alaninecarboxypeptidase/D-alanyl-D-alanine-endopeptidase [Thermoleophilia bacterium]
MNRAHGHVRARVLPLLALVATLLSSTLAAGLLAPRADAASLSSRIDRAVSRSGVAGTTSVYVWDQASRDVIYTRAAGRPVTPASTMKLLTSAAALEHFGPDHRFTTRVALQGTQVGNRFLGDVWLIGGGDPSLSTFGFARDNYRGQGANLAMLVSPLVDRGIEGVTGRIMVDDDLLDELRWVPEWKRSFRFEETGALGALTVNQSLTGKYIGTRSSHLPDIRAGEVYRDLLRRQGVYVAGTTVSGSLPPSASLVGEVDSPPLIDLVAHMTSTSDNFFAETLLKDIGALRADEEGTSSTVNGDGSTADGRRVARAELAALGIDMSGVTWTDGSGLAYANRVTARSLGHVLGVGAQASWGEDWIGGFANSGRTGTLRHRMTRRPFYGRVYAKTGTLNHASALAGFAYRLGSDRRFGFAVITSNAPGVGVSYTRAKHLQDSVAMTLVR